MTVYFVTDTVKTVSDHVMIAERERERFLTELKQPVVSILTEYSVVARMASQTNPDAQKNYLSVYDYFQEIVTLPETEPLYYNRLPVPAKNEIIGDGAKAVVQDQGVDQAQMAFFDVGSREIRDVCYFDAYHRMVKRVWYDYRGFISSEEIFNDTGHKLLQRFFDAKGTEKMTFTYQTGQNGGLILTSIWLHDHRGLDYQFNSYYDLLRLFFKEIAEKVPAALFISDLQGPSNDVLFKQALPETVRRYWTVSEATIKAPETVEKIKQYHIDGLLTAKSTAVLPETVGPVPVKRLATDTFTGELPVTDLGKFATTKFKRVVYYATGNSTADKLLTQVLAGLTQKVTITVLGHYTNEMQAVKQAAEAVGHEVTLIGGQFHNRLLSYFKQSEAVLMLDSTASYSFALNEAVRLGKVTITMSQALDPRLIKRANLIQTSQTAVISEELTRVLADTTQLKRPSFKQTAATDWQFLMDEVK